MAITKSTNGLKKLNQGQRRRLYDYLVEIDGEQCSKCDREPPEVTLDVDKINPEIGYSKKNTQLLCRSCNSKKNPRGKGRKAVDPNYRVDEGQYLPAIIEHAQHLKRRYEERAIYWVQRLGEVEWNELNYSCTQFARCSKSKGHDYLHQLCSLDGPFKRVKREKTYYVVFKNTDGQTNGEVPF